jgi:hypothetical protein
MNTQATKYRPYLLSYMSFLNTTVYEKDYEFSNEELRAATPQSITRWMHVKAYGVEEIGQNDRALCRSSTIEMCKKAVSYFMPHKTAAWNTETQFGNPTKSKEVNDLVKYMKKNEVRNKGQQSKAKRPLTQQEYRKALAILFSKTTFPLRYRLPAMMKLQYNLITRSDELGHFKTEHLNYHSDPRFRSFALEMKVFWSKNVLEERDCPNQILLGSMDPSYCILLSLSLYLEFIWNTGLKTVTV